VRISAAPLALLSQAAGDKTLLRQGEAVEIRAPLD
jgi:hypothetical protein